MSKKQYNKIKNFKPKKTKDYLTIDEQIEKIKAMNFKIDVNINEVKEFLTEENYMQSVKSYEDLFIKFTPRTKYNLYRFEIDKENLDLKSITKFIKQENKYEYVESDFSELIEIKKTDEKLFEYFTKEIKPLELIIKNKLIDIIALNCGKLHWSAWLLEITPEEFRTDIKKLLIKQEVYKDSLYYGIHRLTLGELKQILNTIFKTDELSPEIKSKSTEWLFNDGLGKGFDETESDDYDILLSKLMLLTRTRNYIAHYNRFSVFLLNERFKHMNQLKDDENLKFWFIFNQCKDKRFKTLITKHKLFKNITKEMKLLKLGKFNSNNRLKNKIINKIKFYESLSNPIFDDIKLGYYIEVEDVNSGKVWCLDFKIFDEINWWLKKEK